MTDSTDAICSENYKYLFDRHLLRDKVALVTGGGSGIGFTITEVLMRHGCHTVIASRKLEKVQAAAKELVRGTGGRCLALKMDVRDPKQVDDTFDKILQHYGRLDILINNAAGNFLCPVSSLSTNAFKTVMEIDTVGTFNVTRAAYLKYMQAHGGVILNISATLHYRGRALQTHAGSAKAAIDAMTKHLAVEWGPNRVRINSLAPGPIADTEGYRRLGGKFADNLGHDMWASLPLQRAGTRLEMGHAALFLVSEASDYVTGASLVADGGDWLGTENSMHRLMVMMKANSKL